MLQCTSIESPTTQLHLLKHRAYAVTFFFYVDIHSDYSLTFVKTQRVRCSTGVNRASPGVGIAHTGLQTGLHPATIQLCYPDRTESFIYRSVCFPVNKSSLSTHDLGCQIVPLCAGRTHLAPDTMFTNIHFSPMLGTIYQINVEG